MLVEIAKRLQHAESFVGIGETVCEESAARFGHRTQVTLSLPSGRPILAIDNLAITDDERLAYFTDRWRDDPLDQALRASGMSAHDARTVVVPLRAGSGLGGSIRCARPVPFSAAQRGELEALATHVSVRIAQLGIAVAPVPLPLSPRQLDVAKLAASGSTNGAIAEVLRVSENTVKTHLKDVFERLEVTNRVELAVRIASSAPHQDLPVGITRRGAVTITRGIL